MASKTSLTAENLENLGASRLAQLLLDVTENDAEARRFLRMELIATHRPTQLVTEIGKRLATIARSRSELNRIAQRKLLADLENQRNLIMRNVAVSDPATALSLIWQILDVSAAVLDRCFEEPGALIGFFRDLQQDAADIAGHLKTLPDGLVERIARYILSNHYAQFDGLLPAVSPVLGTEKLEELKAYLLALSKQKVKRPAKGARKVIGWSTRGPVYKDEMETVDRKYSIELALEEIADLQGDVDGFIARYSADQQKFSKIATNIALRLLAAERFAEALSFLDNAGHHQGRYDPWLDDFAWLDTRIAVLEALEWKSEALEARREAFYTYFSARHLKDYLAGLPDFEDFEAEEKALDHARHSDNWQMALLFLVEWGALEKAAAVVVERREALDGGRYEIWNDVADALSEKYPLAATMVLRAMIDFTLEKTRASRYRYAANHLLECESLAKRITSFDPLETHEEYVQRLRRENPRKSAFWEKLP